MRNVVKREHQLRMLSYWIIISRSKSPALFTAMTFSQLKRRKVMNVRSFTPHHFHDKIDFHQSYRQFESSKFVRVENRMSRGYSNDNFSFNFSANKKRMKILTLGITFKMQRQRSLLLCGCLIMQFAGEIIHFQEAEALETFSKEIPSEMFS